MATVADSPEQQVTEYRARAKHFLARKQFEPASALLTQALAISQSHKLYRLRAIAYASLHRFEESLEDATSLLKLMPKCADGWYQKGFAHYHLYQYSEAARAFGEGLTLNPGDKLLHQGFWDSMMLISQARTKDELPSESSLEENVLRIPEISATLAKVSSGELQGQLDGSEVMRMASAALGMLPQPIDVQRDTAAALIESQAHLAGALGTGLAGPAGASTLPATITDVPQAGLAADVCEEAEPAPSITSCGTNAPAG